MKILIVRNDRLGDFVLALPVFHNIKQNNVNIRTVALVSPSNAEFARNMNAVDEVIVDDKDRFIKMVNAVADVNPDISITLFSTFRIGLILFLSRIKKRIAPATKLAQIFHNTRVIQRRSKCSKKEYEYNLDLLKAVDDKIDLTLTRPVIPISKTEQKNALADFKKEYGIRGDYFYIAFHPGFGGSSSGNLTVDEFIDLAQIVNEYKRFKTVFTFGPDESDLREKVEKKVDFESVFYSSGNDAYRFCKLISNFSLFVSTSTGTMHLAGAVNINTLSFFGDTLAASPERWGALNENERQMNVTIPFDRLKRRECIEEIKNKLRHFMENYGAG